MKLKIEMRKNSQQLLELVITSTGIVHIYRLCPKNLQGFT